MDEVSTARVTWRKSTRSNGSGNCVEVAGDPRGRVGLRDSKDPSGPVLAFEPEAWVRFVAGIAQGSFRS
ncbi:DUF397 domain-containing protein [Micromonospora sp. WMMD980]|uniref:DUF397 domain-containing protein n=1 Tax=Micromonospora sp. WMMD980 TaxID=3016088 RepID=UPI0024173593|nr:DUF397 domain-containing protein [Micromonospora sp. WMMD980]MDG4799333.1 DUF397 domain-containing protein [Micromonospora sp. WMMD980]